MLCFLATPLGSFLRTKRPLRKTKRPVQGSNLLRRFCRPVSRRDWTGRGRIADGGAVPEERIELSSPAYEVGILPLNYTGKRADRGGVEPQSFRVDPGSNRASHRCDNTIQVARERLELSFREYETRVLPYRRNRQNVPRERIELSSLPYQGRILPLNYGGF